MTSPIGPNKRPRGRRHRPAFTLFELILVLAVLALSAAMAAPSLSRFSRGRQSLDSAAHLLALMQYAQNQAVITASPYRLALDTNAGTYHLATRHDGAFSRLPTEWGRDFNLPQSLSASWNAPADVSTRGYLEFAPDGSHDVAAVNLTSTDGEVTIIGCDSPSEPFRITAGASQEGAQ
jgi:prepilin-type N-terminal cleavage/methylation domain-containing protein